MKYFNFIIVLLFLSLPVCADSGSRLLISGGITGFEGSAGGGITPWAFINGYGSREEINGTANVQILDTGDYQLQTAGIAIGLYDKFELSYQRQNLDVSSDVISSTFNLLNQSEDLTAPGTSIRQDIFGAKLRVYGDAIFSTNPWTPQISLGIHYKRNHDVYRSLRLSDGSTPLPGLGVPALLGAEDDKGVDVYLSATKYLLGAIGGNNLLLNVTLRRTKANTFGLLGFGSESDNSYATEVESSIAMTLSNHLVVGAEYRTQSDRLGGLASEDHIKDIFLAYFPNKNWSVTAAYLDMGNLPFDDDTSALYLSLTANF